ncbi:MAG: histone deacetylase [Candidatus Electryoneaceae bacterium]|nr:histone deacetylase [Candidatus Electryoneaceae bacterium]
MNRLGLAYHELFTVHDAGPDHPECPERIRAVMDAIKQATWDDAVDFIEAREALSEEVGLAHDHRYINAMRRLCDAGGAYLVAMESNVGEESYPAALRAVGAGLTLADGVMDGKWSIGFAPTRPPGHHATWDRPRGFCIFNNMAVLARYLMDRHNLERIGIFDFDVHHGNGTETAFWRDRRVFYCSIHRDNLFPYDRGRVLDRGEGGGEGSTLNIPLQAGSGDDVYIDAMEKNVIPHFAEFDPQIILVSAGFDAHWKDIIGGMRLTGEGYAAIAGCLIKMASGTSQGRIITLLEGGYSLEGLAEGVTRYLGRLIEG